jgi:monoamine oxidase
MNGQDPARAEVVVVGAGLAGLTAAREIDAAGASVVVLEARDRVGGRTYTSFANGVPLETGAQWIGSAQRRIVALAEELGVEFSRPTPLDAPFSVKEDAAWSTRETARYP